MATDTENANKLTPELVVMATNIGLLDGGIPELIHALQVRRDYLFETVAQSLRSGDKFLVVNCSPKKWVGIEVEFSHRDGKWLKCKLTQHDAVRLNQHMMMTGFQACHVGLITHREG